MYQKTVYGHVTKHKSTTSAKEKSILEFFLQTKQDQLRDACVSLTDPVLEGLRECHSEFDVEQLVTQHIDEVGRLYWQLALSNWSLAYLSACIKPIMPDVNLQGQFNSAFENTKLALIEDVQTYREKADESEPSPFSKLFDKFFKNLYDEINRISCDAVLLAISNNEEDETQKSFGEKAFYRFVASSGSCSACSALDGHIFLLSQAEEGVNRPLIHPNCNCKAEAVDGSHNIAYTWSDLSRILGNMDFNSVSSLLLDSRVFTAENGTRSVVSGDQHILSSEDYATMLALDNLYRSFALVGDRSRADAVKYQMVKIRQKDAYRGQYQQSDSSGIYHDNYSYSNLAASKNYYFVLEHLDETKLLKHGGKGTTSQEAIFSIMTALSAPPEKTITDTMRWIFFLTGSLYSDKIKDINIKKWSPADWVSFIDETAKKLIPDYNHGSALKKGDVYVYMASNDQNKVAGTDFFFRDKELLYFKNQMEKKVRHGN